MEDVYVYQDNQSDILLETNGRTSVEKGTRHVKIKHFFVADKVKNNKLKILYCPTKEMISDFFTNPLQGSLFKVHRKSILGITHDYMPLYLEQYVQFMKSRVID